MAYSLTFRKLRSGPIISQQIDGETVETVSDFILGGTKITADGDCSHEIKRCLLFGRKVMTNLDYMFKSINSSALSFQCSVLSYSPTLTSIHDHWKNHSFDKLTFVGRVMSLLFSMLSRLVITFLPRSKHLLISWLQSPSAVILEPKKIKSLSTWKSAPSVGSALLC